ncbi:UDP-N-acetylglucosamine-N-acetylmuramylpentapeptide N-acetylglucosamine transferase [Salegentibacter echinorum]|uniref:UDP-N-acetylglucosamine--N-acetylmuramyl-(pentapeptide) pyrophosphoryl-undecaprenol N-acetylglucosamine transferase n=1 Tax=Salegentibacter echinorum TaxID=1073325 RepID=A0A1M5GP03_SALEC|nr:undecaprenyldiphospho-muramoylpentapeptide beta-N-acetylglucosaminyltransferase [Salegentibacter echinorum]SHG05520.1 UDP-N-acetylglucosamine-N-acetylmuramylpentapeptide N-acetylglucosamine transferase [Salegentibacter echinorum]
MKKDLRVILSGGGTGGHIYPAIAIANEIKARNPKTEILFVGASNRMEMEKVPQAGYEIEGLWISGIQRKLSLDNLMFPFKLMSSLAKSRRIIKQFKPDVVIGTGGFASGPLLKVAGSLRIPSLIQEQNSFPGITNKLLAKKADKICAAYEEVKRFFPADKTVITGNPVRQDLLKIDQNKEKALSHFGLNKDKKVVLVLGGSLGARRINQLVEENLELFKEEDIQVIWQTGKLYYEEYKKYHSALIQTHLYLNEMNLAYSAADVIISRAGAGTVSELSIVGKPVLFVPSPNVAEDHQAKNASSVVKKEAALMLKENELDEKFKNIFLELMASDEQQRKMGRNIKKLALPHATAKIVDEVEKLIIK